MHVLKLLRFSCENHLANSTGVAVAKKLYRPKKKYGFWGKEYKIWIYMLIALYKVASSVVKKAM